MRAVVFANGELPSDELVAEVMAGAELIVAADGGAGKALATGVAPDAVVGDMDSLTEEARAALGPGRLHAVVDDDTTDLQKAIAFCLGQGATRIDVLAAGGGRADHALANLSVLTLFRGHADIRLVDDWFEISLVDGEAVIDAPVGTVVSLIAIGQCQGVTTEGLRWELSGHTLAFSPHGVHNEVARRPAKVRVRDGDLLLFHGRWVEKHR